LGRGRIAGQRGRAGAQEDLVVLKTVGIDTEDQAVLKPR
jgi:hypothetical protein